MKEILIALVTLDSDSLFLSYSNSTIVCDHVNCPSYSCLTLKQCAFGLVHLRLGSFCPSLLFLRSLVTAFMQPLLSTLVNHFLTSLCVFISLPHYSHFKALLISFTSLLTETGIFGFGQAQSISF